jgi:hypothetical protein
MAPEFDCRGAVIGYPEDSYVTAMPITQPMIAIIERAGFKYAACRPDTDIASQGAAIKGACRSLREALAPCFQQTPEASEVEDHLHDEISVMQVEGAVACAARIIRLGPCALPAEHRPGPARSNSSGSFSPPVKSGNRCPAQPLCCAGKLECETRPASTLPCFGQTRRHPTSEPMVRNRFVLLSSAGLGGPLPSSSIRVRGRHSFFAVLSGRSAGGDSQPRRSGPDLIPICPV